MIRIRDIVLPQTHDEHALRYHAAQCLRVQASDIASLKIFRRSLDARKKPELTERRRYPGTGEESGKS